MSSAPLHQLNRDYLTIGALAKRCDVTVRTLRYYEEMDLIGPVKRTAGKYRLYNENSLKRVKAIQALQDLGFSLEEVLMTLGPYSKSRTYTRQQQLELTRQSLEHQRICVDDKLAKLEALKREIDARLKMLESHCAPCCSEKPGEGCHEDCHYLEVHN